MKKKCKPPKKYVRHGAGVYTKSALSEWNTCFVAALIEGLKMIDEKAKEKGISDEPIYAFDKYGAKHNTGESAVDHLMNADALVHYVRVRGDQFAHIYGAHP